MTGSRLVAILATAAVVAAIVAGLILTGSPATQRTLRLDERRVADLRRLSTGVSRYYNDTGELPDRLDRMVDGRILSALPRDPISDEPYGYEIASRGQFRLCADFALETEAGVADDFWSHDAGPTCYDFDFSSRRLDQR